MQLCTRYLWQICVVLCQHRTYSRTTPSCLESGWIRITQISRSSALLCISSPLRGLQRNTIVFWKCVSAYGVVMWRFCLLLPASSGRCQGRVVLGDMMDIIFHLAVWNYQHLQYGKRQKETVSGDRGCLVGHGSGEWGDGGVLFPALTMIASRIDGVIYFVVLWVSLSYLFMPCLDVPFSSHLLFSGLQ